MKARQERQALADLRWIQRQLRSVTDRRVLDALARDAEDTRDFDEPDIVHKAAKRVCDNLATIATLTVQTKNILSGLEAVEPTGERTASVPDCMACGELALPRPKGGLCNRCAVACSRRDRVEFPDKWLWVRAVQSLRGSGEE